MGFQQAALWEQGQLEDRKCSSQRKYRSYSSQRKGRFILAPTVRDAKSKQAWKLPSLSSKAICWEQTAADEIWGEVRSLLELWKQENTYGNAQWAEAGTDSPSLPSWCWGGALGLSVLPSPDRTSLIFLTGGSVLLWHQGKWISRRETCFSSWFFPVDFYIREHGVKSSFLPWSKIVWKYPDVHAGRLCVLPSL